ncbi:MAG: hypothetical protein PVS3B3_31860 [Ktedonobacteraceae bacterium]
MHMIPYTHGERPVTLPSSQLIPPAPGEYQAVHITVEAAALDLFIATIGQWFDDREEVIFVGSGSTYKEGIGFITLEWEECRVDTLFLRILDTTDFIVDYAVYIRSEEV